MNKSTMINEIVRVYDENEDLKRKISILERPAGSNVINKDMPTSNVALLVYDIGKKTIFDSAFYGLTKGWRKDSYLREGKRLLPFDEVIARLDFDCCDTDFKKQMRDYAFSDLIKFFTKELKEFYAKEAEIDRLNNLPKEEKKEEK